jgi:hypothetical protein
VPLYGSHVLYFIPNFYRVPSIVTCNFLFAPNAIQVLRPECSGKLRQQTHEGGKVIRTTYRSPLHPRNTLCTHCCYRLSQLQDQRAAGKFKSMKNPNPSRIEPATFKQLHRRVPPERIVAVPITRVSKTLFCGTANYSRIFAFLRGVLN